VHRTYVLIHAATECRLLTDKEVSMDSARAGHAALASLCALLPAIDTLAELKVILCLLDAAVPLGREDICAPG